MAEHTQLVRAGRRKATDSDQPESALHGCSYPLRLSLLKNALTAAEKKVGEYFLGNPEAAYLSITEVAQTSALGYGTIIRFCQKMGCAGFQDFKVLLAQELGVAGRAKNEAHTDSVTSYVEKTRSDLRNTANLLDRKVLKKIAGAMAGARFVQVAGIAGSAALAHGFNYRLSRVGIYSAAYTEGYPMAIRAATLKKGDVFFGMSFSGATKDLVNAAQIAKRGKATVLALTGFIKSPLGEVADETLVGVSDRDPFSCEIFSNVPRDFVLDLLFAEICGISPKADELIQKTFEAISDRRI
jgi:RpiR family carbohydrate utilization transcriptional regulator